MASPAALAAALGEVPVLVAARAGMRPLETPFVLELPSAEVAALAASSGAEPSWPDCASAAALAADDPLSFATACELAVVADELDLPLESAESAADFGLLELAGFEVEDGFDAVDECLLVEAAGLAAAARSFANRSVPELRELDDFVVPVEEKLAAGG